MFQSNNCSVATPSRIERKVFILNQEFLESNLEAQIRSFKESDELNCFNDDLVLSDVNRKSFINFCRFYSVIRDFIRDLSESIFISDSGLDDGIVFIVLKNKEELLSLELRFLVNGKIRFLSMDDDELSRNERQYYVIDGIASISNSLSKSRKISRLLRMLLNEPREMKHSVVPYIDGNGYRAEYINDACILGAMVEVARTVEIVDYNTDFSRQ